MARIRSPNYPSMSLPLAIEKIRAIHKVEGLNPSAREAIAKAIGFSTLNGASATALSALAKYGLLQAVGDGEARVSDLAMRVMFPDDESEKSSALQEAAFRPVLFKELREKWPERPPSDDSLRSYLSRQGFSEGAIGQVIQFYRETIEIASSSTAVHDSPSIPQPKESGMSQTAAANQAPSPMVPPQIPQGKPFTVAFDGTVLTGALAIRTVKDLDRLLKVLAAQKVSFEAMEEDEEPEQENFDEGADDDL